MNDIDGQDFPRLVVGLGNPGPRYQNNRHNLGFMVIEALAAAHGLEFMSADSPYLATPLPAGENGLVLLKPLTYMNLSGEAVGAWLDRHDLEPRLDRILVVCDDLALPLGTLRLRSKGSSGGQNGLASVIEHLAGDRFPRLRLGIDGTETGLDPESWPDYVLADFTAEEKTSATRMVERAVQAVECWLEKGLEQAASRFNGRPENSEDDG